MLFYTRIGQQFVCGIQALAEVHFIVEFMQAVMTFSAHRDRTEQLRLAKVLLKMFAAVQFARNKMVSGQLRRPLTQFAMTYCAFRQ